VHAHPDDIEFTIAGTLLLLKERGCEIHYMNVANGSCGTAEYSREEIIRIRREEGRAAARYMGATFHESLTDDMEVFYDKETLRRLASVMREVAPDIILTASPQDYMEDHMNTCRLAVSAAFIRQSPNFPADPPRETVGNDVVVYHAMPHGLRDGLRNSIAPDFCVDITDVMERKAAMLAFHASQKDWLDRTQGFGSYIETMRSLSRQVGELTGRFHYAEGWRRHSHLGFSREEIDPLPELLGADLVYRADDGPTAR